MGSYRGAAHSRCNLAYRISKSDRKLPVVIHNLKGYDGNLIFKAPQSEFGDEFRAWSRISPSLWTNSSLITSQSLESLVKILEVDEFKYVRDAFPIAHEFELIKRKGVYPYDYMDNSARFDESSRLSSQDAFFSKLSDIPCSNTEYALATQIKPLNVSQWRTTTTST